MLNFTFNARLNLVLEHFFTGLLVAATIAIAWFSGYVIYKLFKGQDWVQVITLILPRYLGWLVPGLVLV